MDYNKEIAEARAKLDELISRKAAFQQELLKLKVGDTVYEEGCAGIGFDYYPQTVLEIDVENCRILIHEESIITKKWISSFTLYDEETRSYKWYY